MIGWKRWIASSWIACIASCAGLPAVEGGPAWWRVESEHFTLYSDLGESDARDAISRFETLLSAYSQLGWEVKGQLPVKLEVVVFADRSDFEVFSGATDGFHLQLSLFEPVVVMPNSDRWDGWTTLKHELTHFIAFQSLPFQPPWFAEGLACYFETARFEGDERFVVGEVSKSRFYGLQSMWSVRAKELVTAETAELSPEFYASAWLLVHYLMSEHAEAFVKFQDTLHESLSAAGAWQRAFPHLPIEQLEERLARYVRDGQYAKFSQAVRPYASAVPKASRLSDADVHALRARLYIACPACGVNQRAIADDHLKRALRLEPDHLRASELRIVKLESKGERLAAARSLTAAHPEAWRAWLLRASAELGDGSRCTSEVVARLRETPTAYAQMFAAVCDATTGAKQAALDRSARALRLQPANGQLLLLRAKLLLGLRECDALEQLMPRLRGATHPKFTPADLAPFDGCRSAGAT